MQMEISQTHSCILSSQCMCTTHVQCSILAKKVTCTCACNFKKLHTHNLVYLHMMLMMKYMYKIYVVILAMVIPCDISASISSLRRVPLMSRVMPHYLHCEIETQHFHHAAKAEQIYLILIFTFFYYFPLLLVTAQYLLEMLFFIIGLRTLTNIVKQVIENLHAHVHVGWKILLAPRKKCMHLCKCACLKSSTAHVQSHINIAYLLPSKNFTFIFFACIISRHIGNWT